MKKVDNIYDPSVPSPEVLGSAIPFENLTPDQAHASMKTTLSMIQSSEKPILMVFTAWPHASSDTVQYILSHPTIAAVTNSHFLPVAFNTNDRSRHPEAMSILGGKFFRTHVSFVRIVTAHGEVLAQLGLDEDRALINLMRLAMLKALIKTSSSIPRMLRKSIVVDRK